MGGPPEDAPFQGEDGGELMGGGLRPYAYAYGFGGEREGWGKSLKNCEEDSSNRARTKKAGDA
jgi:hypothetical protein